MRAADLTDEWIRRTVAVHAGKRTHVGRITYVGRTPLGVVMIDLDTGSHDVDPETVITDQEVGL